MRGVPGPDPDERRRIAHAIVGYARTKNQKALAAQCGMTYNQLRNVLNDRDPAPSTDVLRQLAAGVDVPDEFAVNGWRIVAGWAPPLRPDVAADIPAPSDVLLQTPGAAPTTEQEDRSGGTRHRAAGGQKDRPQ